MSEQGPRSPTEDSPLNSQILAAVEAAQEALRENLGTDSESIVRLQIAHSLSLTLADAAAQVRRLQTLALAGQAAAQRSILDGGDAEAAHLAAELGHGAVTKATLETLDLARAISELAGTRSD